ncbi:MAG: bacillithiol biosynthesis cysteine-adding enzyme BshC [Candidatus Latescibacterota bacterium]
MKIIEARSFFPSDRPHGLPGDASTHDWGALVEQTHTLDPAGYPLAEVRVILERENARLGADEAALTRIRSIGPDTVFVVAGQQAGLFGGPLYTLYKALHAVRLAERLAKETGRPVIAVFWTASDDHDFEEVRSVEIRTADGSPWKAEYAPANLFQGAPVGEIVLAEGIIAVLDQRAEHLPPGDRAEYCLSILRRCWKPGARWSDAFSAQLTALLSARGLVLLDPRWSGVKALFRTVMRAELENPLASSAAVNEEADRFETARERRKALRKPENSTNLFLEVDNLRQPLLVAGDGFRAGNGFFPKEDLLSLLEVQPERFSPGAALRPLCQDALLPVAALIAGPGERRYLGQIRTLYGRFGVNGSLPWPRASFTLVDHRSLRTAEKEGIPVERLFEEPEKVIAERAAQSLPPALRESLSALERDMAAGFDAVAAATGEIDPTLTGAVEKEKGKAMQALEKLRERAIRTAKSRLELAESRFAATHRFLLPEGEPQERRFGFDAALTVLGPEGVFELLGNTSPGEEYHRLVFPE